MNKNIKKVNTLHKALSAKPCNPTRIHRVMNRGRARTTREYSVPSHATTAVQFLSRVIWDLVSAFDQIFSRIMSSSETQNNRFEFELFSRVCYFDCRCLVHRLRAVHLVLSFFFSARVSALARQVRMRRRLGTVCSLPWGYLRSVVIYRNKSC